MSPMQYEAWARNNHDAITPKLAKGDRCPSQHRRWTHDNITRITHCTDCSRDFSGSQLVGPLPD